MKTLSIFSRKALLLAVAAVTFALPGRAQLIQNTYLNVDWQVTVPLGSAFADKASGWGMNFEGGYFVTPEITVGAFISTRPTSSRSAVKPCNWAAAPP